MYYGKNILSSLFLLSTVSLHAMLVKQATGSPQFYTHSKQLSRWCCNTHIKQNPHVRGQIFYVIADNLYVKKDAPSWRADVQDLVKKFPQKEDMIYNEIDELVKKHYSPNPRYQKASKSLTSLGKLILLPGSAALTLSVGAHSVACTFLSVVGEVGDTVLEKLGYIFIAVPCAWTLTGGLALFTINLFDTINFEGLSKSQLNMAMQKYNNVRALQEIVKQHRASTKTIQHNKNDKDE